MGRTPKQAVEVAGLWVSIDRVEYHPELPARVEQPYPLVYFITIHNDSDRTVRLTHRKWIVTDAAGEKYILEGEAIVGKKPRLEPGEIFSYNSYHIIGSDSIAEGSYHGVDEFDNRIFVRIPPFALTVPAA
ncbi:MAG: Protein ApaG [Verrucomicrobiae bacterium]|nr:Protein ApaG [Verrucomicrobiae bacterium]